MFSERPPGTKPSTWSRGWYARPSPGSAYAPSLDGRAKGLLVGGLAARLILQDRYGHAQGVDAIRVAGTYSSIPKRRAGEASENGPKHVGTYREFITSCY